MSSDSQQTDKPGLLFKLLSFEVLAGPLALAAAASVILAYRTIDSSPPAGPAVVFITHQDRQASTDKLIDLIKRESEADKTGQIASVDRSLVGLLHDIGQVGAKKDFPINEFGNNPRIFLESAINLLAVGSSFSRQEDRSVLERFAERYNQALSAVRPAALDASTRDATVANALWTAYQKTLEALDKLPPDQKNQELILLDVNLNPFCGKAMKGTQTGDTLASIQSDVVKRLPGYASPIGLPERRPHAPRLGPDKVWIQKL